MNPVPATSSLNFSSEVLANSSENTINIDPQEPFVFQTGLLPKIDNCHFGLIEDDGTSGVTSSAQRRTSGTPKPRDHLTSFQTPNQTQETLELGEDRNEKHVSTLQTRGPSQIVQILYKPWEHVIIIGPNSQIGMNHVWLERGARFPSAKPNGLTLMDYMRLRAWCSHRGMNIPHPSKHLAARLVAHHGHFRTPKQFGSVITLLHRIAEDEQWKMESPNWRSHEIDRQELSDADFLYRRLRFDISERSSVAKGDEETIFNRPEGSIDWIRLNKKYGQLRGQDIMRYLTVLSKQALRELEWVQTLTDTEHKLANASVAQYLLARCCLDNELVELLNRIWTIRPMIIYCGIELRDHNNHFETVINMQGSDLKNIAEIQREENEVSYAKIIGDWMPMMGEMPVGPPPREVGMANEAYIVGMQAFFGLP